LFLRGKYSQNEIFAIYGYLSPPIMFKFCFPPRNPSTTQNFVRIAQGTEQNIRCCTASEVWSLQFNSSIMRFTYVNSSTSILDSSFIMEMFSVVKCMRIIVTVNWRKSSNASRNQLDCEALRGRRYWHDCRPRHLLNGVRTACFCWSVGWWAWRRDDSKHETPVRRDCHRRWRYINQSATNWGNSDRLTVNEHPSATHNTQSRTYSNSSIHSKLATYTRVNSCSVSVFCCVVFFLGQNDLGRTDLGHESRETKTTLQKENYSTKNNY